MTINPPFFGFSSGLRLRRSFRRIVPGGSFSGKKRKRVPVRGPLPSVQIQSMGSFPVIFARISAIRFRASS